MSIRQGMLAMLEQGPMYGYQLRAEFEQRTGATWPLNIGQVYTTLARLERDGLVSAGPATDERGARSLRITDGRRGRGGRAGSPPRSPRTSRPRDELAIKLAMAVTTARRRRRPVIQGQRTATMRALQDSPGSSGASGGARATSPGCWSWTR